MNLANKRALLLDLTLLEQAMEANILPDEDIRKLILSQVATKSGIEFLEKTQTAIEAFIRHRIWDLLHGGDPPIDRPWPVVYQYDDPADDVDPNWHQKFIK